MSLTGKKCVPCEGGVKPLSAEEIKQLLAKVSGWEVSEGNTKISKRYAYSNFKKSLAFVNKVGEIAETEKHHPDITFGWGYAVIELQTHAINGLHENDFIVAAKINEISDS